MKRSLIFSLLIIVLHLVSAQTPKNLRKVNSPKIIQQGIEQFDKQKYMEAEKLFKSIPLGDTLYNFAQYELALTYSSQERHDEAMDILARLLESENEDVGKNQIFGLLANTYSDKDMLKEAIEVYNKALKIYPYHYNLHYNKGVVYGKMDNYEEMLACAKSSLLSNPSHQTSHYQLGIAYLRMNCFVPGILALNYAILINPTSSVAFRCLQTLDDLYADGFDAFNEGKNIIIPEEMKAKNNEYLALEQLLRSNFAMAKGFKLKSSIKQIIVYQNQLIFENLEENSSSWEIEDQLYIPTFKTIMAEKKGFDTYSYLMFQGTNIDNNKVSEKAAKMEKQFTELYNKVISLLRTTIEKGLSLENKEKLSYTYQDNFNLDGFGKYIVDAAGKNVYDGNWTIIDNSGRISFIAGFKNGIADGKWIYFDNKGNIEREIQVENGKSNGDMYFYFPNDTNKLLNIKLPFVNGAITGTRYEYNRSNVLIEESQWKDDLYDGLVQSFYPQGNKKSVLEYKEGTVGKKGIAYYEDGKTIYYQAEPIEESEKSVITYYYPDVTVSAKGFLLNGTFVDEYSTYYSNGKLKMKGQFNHEGNEIGQWTYYDWNGNITYIYSSENGKRHGDEIYYLPDGRQTMKIIWKNGTLSEVINYNPDGSEKERKTPKNKQITLDFYFTDKNISYLYKQITMKNNGDHHGKYYVYAPSGVVLEERNYKDNMLEGTSKAYYPTGKLKNYEEYKNNVANGLFLAYDENDSLTSEGYYKDGLPAYIWYYYHPNGAISSTILYDRTQLVNKKDYYPNGQLSSEVIFKNGLYSQQSLYDKNGNLLGINTFKNGNGEYKSYHQNGNLNSKVSMNADNFTGQCIMYDFSGKELTTINYVEGLINGEFKMYNDLVSSQLFYDVNCIFDKEYGILKRYSYSTEEMSEGNYRNGMLEDTTKTYFEEGKLNAIFNYAGNERNGTSTYFAADGKTVSFRLKYNQGQIYAYAYMDKNGKMTDFLPFGKEKIFIISYYPNGAKSREITFENFLRQEKEILYYPNGKIFRETGYIDDKYNGEQKMWFENGKLKSIENYQHDLCNGKAEYFYDNEKSKLTIDYVDGFIHGVVELYNTTGKLTETQKWFYNNRIE